MAYFVYRSEQVKLTCGVRSRDTGHPWKEWGLGEKGLLPGGLAVLWTWIRMLIPQVCSLCDVLSNLYTYESGLFTVKNTKKL